MTLNNAFLNKADSNNQTYKQALENFKSNHTSASKAFVDVVDELPKQKKKQANKEENNLAQDQEEE